MRPSYAPAVQLPVSELEAKLALAEFLLTSSDLQASARRAVDWLVGTVPPPEPEYGVWVPEPRC